MLTPAIVVKKLTQVELITLIQNGNISAFDEFYRQNWRALYQMAYHSTGNIDDAKDLVQNVFINFWNTRESIDALKFQPSYLFTSLRNGIINQYKKDAVKKRGAEVMLHQIETANGYTTEDAYIAKEFALQINARVRELPAKMQQVFVLSRYEQLSVKEISESLQIEPRTVKNQLSNAIKILRTKVGLLGLPFILIFLF